MKVLRIIKLFSEKDKEEEKDKKKSSKSKVAKNLMAGAGAGSILALPTALGNGFVGFGKKLAEKESSLFKAAARDLEKEQAVQLVEEAINGNAHIKGSTPEKLAIVKQALPKMKERVALDKKATEKFTKKVIGAAKKAGGKKALKALGTGAVLGIGGASILTALDKKNSKKKK